MKPGLQVNVVHEAEGASLLTMDGRPVAAFYSPAEALAFAMYPQALATIGTLLNALQRAGGKGPMDEAVVTAAVASGQAFLRGVKLSALGVFQGPRSHQQ